MLAFWRGTPEANFFGFWPAPPYPAVSRRVRFLGGAAASVSERTVGGRSPSPETSHFQRPG